MPKSVAIIYLASLLIAATWYLIAARKSIVKYPMMGFLNCATVVATISVSFWIVFIIASWVLWIFQ